MAAGSVGSLNIALTASAQGLIAGFREGTDAVRRFASTSRAVLSQHQSEYIQQLRERMAVQRQYTELFARSETARRSSAWLANETRNLSEQRDVLREIANESYKAGASFKEMGASATTAGVAVQTGFLAGLREQFGRGSQLTLLMKTLRGSGAIIGLTLISNAIERMGSEMKTAAAAMAAGEKNWADLILQFTYSLPIVGGVVKGLSDMAEALDFAITGRKTAEMLTADAKEAASSADVVEQARRRLAVMRAETEAARQRLAVENEYIDSLRTLDAKSSGGQSDPGGYRKARELLEVERAGRIAAIDKAEYNEAVRIEFERLDKIYEHQKQVALEALQYEQKSRNEAADQYKHDVDAEFKRLDTEYERLKTRRLDDLLTEQRMRWQDQDERKRADEAALERAKKLAKVEADRISIFRRSIETPAHAYERQMNQLIRWRMAGSITAGEFKRGKEAIEKGSEEYLGREKAGDLVKKLREGIITPEEFNRGMFGRKRFSGVTPAAPGSEEAWRMNRGAATTADQQMIANGRTTNQFLQWILNKLQEPVVKHVVDIK